MLFNSFVFIFIFLPIVFGVYFLFNRLKKVRLSIYWLILSSLFFYGYFEPQYVILISISIMINFLLGRLLMKSGPIQKKKFYLTLGILFNVLLLGYYKYADFFIANMNIVFGTSYPFLYLLLPIGLSFITFQQIAYLVDAYKGETKRNTFAAYALFITFFPQLIAGPIVHHKEMMPQFAAEQNKRINLEHVFKGIFIFLIGLTKKVAIADTVAVWADDGFKNYQNLTFAESWITSLSYTIQLYFDFSGYCDMAIGLGLLFNIKLPINFNSPYRSRNIQEFWTRWHMTLNRFLTKYVYFPLGGSRKGAVRTYIHIFIIFLISGFWHGAGWNFMIWGVLHGLASIALRLWGRTKINPPYWLSWFITFQFVNIAWVYFRATSVEQANTIIAKMFQPEWSDLQRFFTSPVNHFTEAATYQIGTLAFNHPIFIGAVIGTLLCLCFIAKNSIEWLDRFTFNGRYIVYYQALLMIILISVFIRQKNSMFLYFNF